MNASLTWMKEYVPVNLKCPAQELADTLTQAGIPVENVISVNKGIEKVYTGQIVEITKHPDADKLQICQIKCIDENGNIEIKQIVTGAKNVEVGQIVPVAYHKSHLPNGVVIKKGKLRGVESNGMLCSTNELGISPDLVLPEESNGIYILPPDTPIGKDIKDVMMLNDIVYEFELTANRADCFSMVGLSREIAVMTGKKAIFPTISVVENGEPIDGKVSVSIENKELCTRFISRLVTDIKVGPSPLWMQNRLRNSGIRPINNVVDVTNYVMLELGQPMHAYDYDFVKGHHLIVRNAQKGEVIQTLDGTDRKLTESMLVISDEERPIGVAGVMGGFDSEVTSNSKSIIFEAAVFNGPSIRRTSRSLGMRSEASGRFERGVNSSYTELAIDRACQLLQEICPSCKVASGRIDVNLNPVETRVVNFTTEAINNYLGTDISESTMIDILQSLCFTVTKQDSTIIATIPSWRADVAIMPDIAEEIARIFNYDNIKPTTPWAALSSGSMSPKKELTKKVNHYLSSVGMSQVMTFSFMHKDSLHHLLLQEDDPRYTAIPILNPISEEFPYMRTTLVPAMLECATRNMAQQNKNLWLFETGNVYEPKESPLKELPHERPMACGLMMGKVTEPQWCVTQRMTDFYDIKGVVDGLLADMGITNYIVKRSSQAYLHPGVSASYYVNDVEIARFGELHPQVAKNFDMESKAYIFEIDLEGILQIDIPTLRYEPFSKFPGISRDLAIVAPITSSSEDILKIIRENGGAYLEKAYVFDVYEGEHIEEGFRSLAYTLQFRSMEDTLNDSDVESTIDTIIAKLAEINCKLR